MNICSCPAAASLTTIPAADCPQNFGQIQKVAFMRLRSSAGVENKFVEGVDATAIEKKAAWTAKMAKSDYEKVVISPYIQAPADDGGDARTFGGGNETLGGIEQIIGRNPTTFSGVMRSVPQAIIKAMKALECEAQAGNLGVILFDENGAIEAIKESVTVESTTTISYKPIPIRSLFIGDKKHGNFEALDNNAISWSYLPNYSDDLDIIAASDFNPLTDLIPA
jgi:hypothetical protein